MTQSPNDLLLPAYLASGAILVFVLVALFVLFRIRRQLERVVAAVEECRSELIPLARDARVVMGDLRDISEKTRSGVAEVDVMKRKLRGLLTGVKTFVTVMLHGGTHERK